MTPQRVTLILIISTVLNVHYAIAFGMALKDICLSGVYCNYVVDGFTKTIYGLLNIKQDSQQICLQERIEECSCYEMLTLDKTWIPNWPRLDKLDVKQLTRQTSKKYHPDHLVATYSGDRNNPFIFLMKCSTLFQHPDLRKEYVTYVQFDVYYLISDLI